MATIRWSPWHFIHGKASQRRQQCGLPTPKGVGSSRNCSSELISAPFHLLWRVGGRISHIVGPDLGSKGSIRTGLNNWWHSQVQCIRHVWQQAWHGFRHDISHGSCGLCPQKLPYSAPWNKRKQDSFLKDTLLNAHFSYSPHLFCGWLRPKITAG